MKGCETVLLPSSRAKLHLDGELVLREEPACEYKTTGDLKIQIALALVSSDRALHTYDLNYKVDEIYKYFREKNWIGIEKEEDK